jgi:Arc/MetJ-type ribon-helix-helix transcriptional regulator
MKVKLSITIEENVISKIENSVKTKRFRNKSHLIEYAVDKLLEKE